MSNNKNLNAAKKAKNDEFYTRLEDITVEVNHYHKYLKNKIVYCNCDGETSNFWKYFISNFDNIGVKKIIATKYNINNNGEYLEYNGTEIIRNKLNGNGDFRSEECIDILKNIDIVITNPPFSLFRDFIDVLVNYNKKFLVIGNINTITCINIFPLIKENKMCLGYTQPKLFITPNGKITKKIGGLARWFTNLPVTKNTKLTLVEKYNPKKYPKYDNYDAIEVSKVKNIPIDYTGVIGVPVTFLDGYNPEDFELLGINRRSTYINGKKTYKRIFIKRRK